MLMAMFYVYSDIGVVAAADGSELDSMVLMELLMAVR